MKLPPDVEFYEEVRLLVYRPHGLIDEGAVNKIIAIIEEIEAVTQEPFNRFSDASQASEVELNFRYVIEVSLHRRVAHERRLPVKSAILATDSSVIHYARLLVLLTEGSTIKVRVFQDRAEAAEWLGVPAELVASKA
jgi:hypothetical protein